MVELTRRGFLAGLLGTAVIVSMPTAMAPNSEIPSVLSPIDPFSIRAPDGITYQWVRTALLGEPDPANVEARLTNGWTFVLPSAHPGVEVSTVEDAIETGGLILMQKPTADFEAWAAQFRCGTCSGKGKVVLEEGAPWTVCNACKGSGRKQA